MSPIADVLHPSADADGQLEFWIELPAGYFPLPMDDIDTALATAEANLRELAPEEQRPLLSAVIDTFTVLLEELQERNTAYCGIGWHTAEDGAIVPSSLVVSLQQLPERRNPRLVLRDMVEIRAEAGEHGQVDLVDLEHGPALFFESVLALPRPRIPGIGTATGTGTETAAPTATATATGTGTTSATDPNQDQDATQPTADVYQLQALVPSADGTKLAAIDFSTPDIPHGPRFRAMMVLMANSVSFTPPPGSEEAGETARSIGQILGGLTL
jgi:hypothetical protein